MVIFRKIVLFQIDVLPSPIVQLPEAARGILIPTFASTATNSAVSFLSGDIPVTEPSEQGTFGTEHEEQSDLTPLRAVSLSHMHVWYS